MESEYEPAYRYIRRQIDGRIVETMTQIKTVEKSPNYAIRGSEIDFGMGKIRAFQQILEILK